ncbi:RDD family protein [Brachybacterium subflavum]|uniref:RDD family protein n=1 Tax=Brachybacterium subflavum TaxID=2585206 RepID=UPI00187A27C9|nr:RDD family protein [Brachybacterium subflavum]
MMSIQAGPGGPSEAQGGTPRYCSTCGALLSAGAVLCGECGARYRESPYEKRATDAPGAWSAPPQRRAEAATDGGPSEESEQIQLLGSSAPEPPDPAGTALRAQSQYDRGMDAQQPAGVWGQPPSPAQDRPAAPGGPAPLEPPVDGCTPAGTGKRVLAFIIDGVVAGIAALPLWIGAILLALQIHQTLATILTGLGAALPIAYALVIVWLQGSRGFTLGGLIMGLRVVREDTGAPLGFGRSLARYVVLALLTWIAGLTTFLDPERHGRGLHDRMISTILVDARAGRDPYAPRPDDFARPDAAQYLGDPSVPVSVRDNLTAKPGAAWEVPAGAEGGGGAPLDGAASPSAASAASAPPAWGSPGPVSSPAQAQPSPGWGANPQQSAEGPGAVASPAPAAGQWGAPAPADGGWGAPTESTSEQPWDAPAARPEASQDALASRSDSSGEPIITSSPWAPAPAAAHEEPSAPASANAEEASPVDPAAADASSAQADEIVDPWAPPSGDPAGMPAEPAEPAECVQAAEPAPHAEPVQPAEAGQSLSGDDPSAVWTSSPAPRAEPPQSAPAPPSAPPSGPAPGAEPARAPAPAPAPGPAPAPSSTPEPVGPPADLDESTRLSHPTGDLGDVEETRIVAARRDRRPGYRLLLDDGSAHEVRGVALLGRNPSAEAGEERIVLVDETRSVSKSHLRLEAAVEGLQVTDLGSTNGSALILADGSSQDLDPHSPLSLSDGATLSIGDRTLTVERIQ